VYHGLDWDDRRAGPVQPPARPVLPEGGSPEDERVPLFARAEGPKTSAASIEGRCGIFRRNRVIRPLMNVPTTSTPPPTRASRNTRGHVVGLLCGTVLGFVGLDDAHAEVFSDAALRPAVTTVRLDAPPHWSFVMPGSLLFAGHYEGRTPMGVVDSNTGEPGGDIPAEFALRTRLRVSPALTYRASPTDLFAAYALRAELDLVDAWGPVGSDRDALAADPSLHSAAGLFGDRIEQLHLAFAGRHLSAVVGLVRSDWGLGLVANGGGDPLPHTDASPFGLPRRGDRVARVGFSLTPNGDGLGASTFAVRAAVDAVVDDDFARWDDGDRTYQGLLALSGRTRDVEAGFYLAHRSERHAEGGDTEATVLDAYLRWTIVREEGFEAFIAGEGAAIFGRTSHLLSAAFDHSLTLSQGAGLLRFGVKKGPFLGVIEAGFTSGDEDPFDDTVRSFAMDRDYRVGLVLFPELIASVTAGTVVNLADGAYRRDSPRGANQVATLGAVRGAAYINPRVSFQIDDELVVYAGYLYAQQVGAWVDPFWSGLAGGTGRGPRNGPPSDALGQELDLGLSWGLPLSRLLVRLRVEGAWCRPGAIFADAEGRAAQDIWAGRFYVGLGW